MKRFKSYGRMLLLVIVSLPVVLLPGLSSAEWSQTILQEKTSECRTYAVRRIECIGNEHTRDRIVWRRVTLSVGKTLSEEDIERTLKNLNRLKRLEKLKLEDIEIKYAVEDQATPALH